MRFAKWVFTGAGIYGLIVMLPMYFAEPAMTAAGQPLTHPEHLYGFVGAAVVFQLMFLLIGRDPMRYRPMMLIGVLEKASFGFAVWPLYLMGRTPGLVTAFATVDLLLGGLFLAAWLKTRTTPSELSASS